MDEDEGYCETSRFGGNGIKREKQGEECEDYNIGYKLGED